ncbi:hypothetical protein LAV72_11110 [Lysinibacillus xylanilyticus]|uniref:hypothetical protein n=1 Tax=Lysinibacillus xylanilyticus TaxID=582475 RepID=UPI002B24D7D3|nr:hypothetical protein [Lysinibacillus xylanilyticus]MEB2300168.1 hypothetical protein [Lysinibacillus xylanilyticus]
MYIVLESEYRLINDNNKIYIEHMFNKKIIELSFKEKINLEYFKKLLYFGTTLQLLSNSEKKEDKLIAYLLKNETNIFLLSSHLKDINREINCRSLFMICDEVGTSHEKLVNFKNVMGKTGIEIIGDSSEGLSNYLKDNGFLVRESNVHENNKILVVERSSISTPIESFSNDYDCILPYSVIEMSIGPCLFKNNLSKEDVSFVFENNESKGIPSQANLISMYSLIINTVLYLINNVHQELYIDAGLPINRKFKFSLPDMGLRAFLQT